MASTLIQVQPTYVGPAFEDAKVSDAMRVGVVTCRPATSLQDVGRMMVGYGIHAVVVAEIDGDDRPWGIVTSLDLAREPEKVAELAARDVAHTDVITVDSNASLKHAARLMAEHGISHLVAVQPGTDRPVGVISTRVITAAIVYGQ